MDEVISVFEGQVPDDREAALRDAFVENSAGPMPDGALEMKLLRSPDAEGQWAILTRWRSSDDLARHRQQEDPPREVLAFRGAQVEPTETTYELIEAEEPTPARSG